MLIKGTFPPNLVRKVLMKLLQALNLIQFLFNNRFSCNASVFSFIKSLLTFLGLLPPLFQVNAPEQQHKPHDCHIPTAFSSGDHAGSAEVRGPLLSYSMQLLTLLSCPGSTVHGRGQSIQTQGAGQHGQHAGYPVFLALLCSLICRTILVATLSDIISLCL